MMVKRVKAGNIGNEKADSSRCAAGCECEGMLPDE
jgi:hypothetical protein